MCQAHGSWSSRTTPTACSGSTGSCPGRSGPTRPGVIYLGSFSKTFAPGLRVGCAVAPHGVREKLVLAAEASVLCPPAYSPADGRHLPRDQPWFDQVKEFRELYRERRDALLESMAAHMPPDGTLDRPGRRLLLLGHPARRPGRQRDAAASRHRPRRVRAGHGLLRGVGETGWPALAAAVVLLPRAGPHPGGRTPAGRRRRGRARPRADVRSAVPGSRHDESTSDVPGPETT